MASVLSLLQRQGALVGGALGKGVLVARFYNPLFVLKHLVFKMGNPAEDWLIIKDLLGCF